MARITGGWVLVHRDIDEKMDYETRSFFTQLIKMANFVDGHGYLKYQKVKLKRGQLVTSSRDLSKITGLTQSKVNRLTKRLRTDSAIDTAPTHSGTIITICNYDKYQNAKICRDIGLTHQTTTKRLTNRQHKKELKNKRTKELSSSSITSNIPKLCLINTNTTTTEDCFSTKESSTTSYKPKEDQAFTEWGSLEDDESANEKSKYYIPNSKHLKSLMASHGFQIHKSIADYANREKSLSGANLDAVVTNFIEYYLDKKPEELEKRFSLRLRSWIKKEK